MPKLAFPSGLKPGPLYDLMTDLHYLHALAGWPSVSELAKQLSVGRSTIHLMFTRPELPNRTVFFDVVELMARQARRIDHDEWCDRLCARWMTAYDDERLNIDLKRVLRPPQTEAPDSDLQEDPSVEPELESPPIGLEPRDVRAGPAALRGLFTRDGQPTSPLPDLAQSRAVFVGMSHFQDPRLPRLPGVLMGLQALRAAMIRPNLGSFPSPARVTVLADEESARPVLDAVRIACSEAQDALFLYLAGHGLLSSSGELLLATAETDINASAVEYTALPYSALRKLLAASRAKRKVVVLDCCYSGRAIHETMGPLSGLAAVDTSATVLASTGPYSASFLDGPAGLPVMTGALADTLNEGVIDGPEFLDLDTLHTEIKRRLASRGFPIPALHMQRRDSTPANRLALGRNPLYVTPAEP